MKVMDIRLGCLFLLVFSLLLFLNFVSAININFDFPEKVYQNKEFNVEIKDVDVTGILDVKIYVNSLADKIVSDIYNNKWQSSNYYVKSSYPSQNSFRLIVENYTGFGQICVKLRQSGKSSAIGEVCREIEILTKEESLVPQREEESVDSRVIEENNKNNESGSEIIIDNKIEEVVQLSNNAGVNYLNDKPIVLENKPIHTTSYYSDRVLLIYGFVVLCVIIIILLALRRI